MSLKPLVLIVDDEKNTREGLRRFLEPKGYDVFLASDAEGALDILKNESPEVILTDLKLPEKDGLYLLERSRELSPESAVILFTAYGTIETAVEAMKKGAFHYLMKPVNLDELETTLERALKGKRLERENIELRRELSEKQEDGQIIAKSKAMKEVIEMTRRVAPTNASVLIEGESGTGKELLAHLIHQLSPRKDRPFITVHCAALTETLLLSELFGHEKGSFTGASEKKLGRFERAHTGTIFLDEIGEIKEEMQVKLLRVLQNGEFERVGGTKPLKVDVRLVCATNKNLLNEVKSGKFREDLYYRINVIRIEVPPLRMRKEDTNALIHHFVRHFAAKNHREIHDIEPRVLSLLTRYDWPGNVRELKNVIERMVVLASGEVLTDDFIPFDIKDERHLENPSFPPISNDTYQIKDMEKDLILKMLKEMKGNKSKAAKRLGISRRTLYRKLDEYHLSNE